MEISKIFEAKHIDPVVGTTSQLVSSLKYASPIHCHDYYELFMISKGKCVHRVNGGKQHLAEGDLVFIRPDDIHCYEQEDGGDCEFINIACSNQVIRDAFNYLGDSLCRDKLLSNKLPPCITLSSIEKNEYMDRYFKLNAVSQVDKSTARIIFLGLLMELLMQYLLNPSDISCNGTPLWFDAVLKQMQKKENFQRGLERMIALSERSRGHLNRTFKRYLDTTPTNYINQIRLNFAKNLLLTTSLNVIDISIEAGFRNLSHFNHLFKNHFHISPMGLRMQNK